MGSQPVPKKSTPPYLPNKESVEANFNIFGCGMVYKGDLGQKTSQKSTAKIRGHTCNPPKVNAESARGERKSTTTKSQLEGERGTTRGQTLNSRSKSTRHR